jgi:Mrp family chromosome partitioning ATPase
LLGGLAADYQLVVLDTPSALEVSDAIPLMSQVDCVVVVVRVGRTSRQAAHRLRQLLSEARSPVMVAVANRVRHRRHVSSAYRRRSPATTAARRLDAAQGATATRNGGAT